jgi:hypothetical protein
MLSFGKKFELINNQGQNRLLTNYFGFGIGDFGLKTSPWLFKQGIIQNLKIVKSLIAQSKI